MKRHFTIILAALPLFTGCLNELLSERAPGSPVVFSANTYYDNGPMTKTAYSGQFFGSTSKYERIDWVSGDKIRIFSPQAAHRNGSSRHWADYDIDAGTITPDLVNSTASIINEPNSNGLVWGTESSSTFYGLYPSPRSTGAYPGLAMNDNVVTAPLPETQPLTVQPGTRFYKPDMDLAYMHAAVTGVPAGLPVNLPFKPLMTAIEITLGTDDPDGISVKDLFLFTDDTGSYLTGSFSATINVDNTVTVSNTITNPSRILRAGFPEFANGGTVTIQDDSPVTFTLFALPVTLEHVGLRVVLADNSAKDIVFRKDGDWIRFDACRKYRITNLNTPPGETWTYTIEAVDPVMLTSYDPSHPILTYGHLATTSSPDGLPFIVRSYKTSSRTGVSTPVSWRLEFQAPGGQWTSTLSEAVYYGKLTANLTTGAGSTTGEPVRADIARDHNPGTEYYHHGSIGEDAGTATLRARSPLPSPVSDSGDGYFDLSKHPVYGTIDGAEQARETANCYVITAPGKYKLPLVYGNAIRAGATNTVSYRPSLAPGTNDNDHYMHQFLRHDDNPITGPWITSDNGIPVADAVVVWQDGAATADRQILFNSDITVSGAYIKFEIKKDQIRPGNIVLAARQSDGTIVWSWHLWVTEKDLTPIAVRDLTPITHQMMKYNLGWTDATSAGGYKWEDWDMPVRLVQIENGTSVGDTWQFNVCQHGESGEVDPNVGSNTFYQWGRKDPFLPANYGNTNRPFYTDPALGYEILENGPDGMRVCWRVPPATTAIVSAGHAVRHPNYQYAKLIDDNSRTYLGGRSTVIIGNLWDANMIPYTNTTAGTPDPYDNRLVVKTVYDPCPPGFCVPYGRAYSGLVGSFDGWVSPSNLPSGSRYYASQGWEFPTGVSGKIFFPFTGARGGNGQYIYHVSALGYYWTSQPLNYMGSYREYAKHFFLNDNNTLRARHEQDRAAAYAVRPVLEVSTNP